VHFLRDVWRRVINYHASDISGGGSSGGRAPDRNNGVNAGSEIRRRQEDVDVAWASNVETTDKGRQADLFCSGNKRLGGPPWG